MCQVIFQSEAVQKTESFGQEAEEYLPCHGAVRTTNWIWWVKGLHGLPAGERGSWLSANESIVGVNSYTGDAQAIREGTTTGTLAISHHNQMQT